jgi:hypothetical protein
MREAVDYSGRPMILPGEENVQEYRLLIEVIRKRAVLAFDSRGC